MNTLIKTFALLLAALSSTSQALELCQGQWVDKVCTVVNYPQLDRLCIKQQSRFTAIVTKINGVASSTLDAKIEYVNLEAILSIPSTGDSIDFNRGIYTEAGKDFQLDHCIGQIDSSF